MLEEFEVKLKQAQEQYGPILEQFRCHKIPESYPAADYDPVFGGGQSLDAGSLLIRDEVIHLCGFCWLSYNWVRPLAQWIGSRHCLEIMCGSGALSYALRTCGVQVIATDNFSWRENSGCWYERPWTDIQQMDCLEAIRTYGSQTDLVICSWPYMDDACYRALLEMRKVNPAAQMWEVWPESKDSFFEGITPEDATEFLAVGTDKLPPDAPRLPFMTAGDFFRFCAMGYAANHYSDTEKTPLEQYRRYADNRDDGLCELDQDSPEVFDDWYHNRTQHGGHPWEVCRGGNSTHISLYVAEDEQGYYLKLAGSAWNRTIETVNFFLALHRAGLPVTIMDADILKERLAGTEKIGVVPEGIFPAYCEYLFRGEKIIDFINLPHEDRAEFAKRCVWQPLNEVRLKATDGTS